MNTENQKESETYNVMDLFAGIGGASYAGKLIGNWRTVCYVEWDKYCQRVIQQRIKDGIFDDAPIWGDICTFDGKPWAGSVDIITGGFPCQPFSVAGKRRGESDERNMWPETLRVISEVRPRFAFLENVPGLITSGYFDRIIGDLTEIGYDCRWTIVSAADVGAPQERKRLWILAYPHGTRKSQQKGDVRTQRGWTIDGGQEVADTDQYGTVGNQSANREGRGIKQGGEMADTEVNRTGGLSEREAAAYSGPSKSGKITWWDIDPATCEGAIESQMGRVVNGLPDRRNRERVIGNAWVPATAMEAWFRLTRGLIWLRNK